jgi:hypothetical protein
MEADSNDAIDSSQGFGLVPLLYHYTSMAGAIGILRTKQMWATHLRYLNDSQEFVHGLGIAASILHKRAKSRRDLPAQIILDAAAEMMSPHGWANIFVASFSAHDDVLSQWRGYSAGAGVSFGFRRDQLGMIASQNHCELRQCIYDKDEKESIVEAIVQRTLDHKVPTSTDDDATIESAVPCRRGLQAFSVFRRGRVAACLAFSKIP